MRRILRFVTAIFAISALAQSPGYTSATPDAEAAKKHINEMIDHGEKMIMHGNASHFGEMRRHGIEMIYSAKKAIEAIPKDNPHGMRAVKHIEEAIKHAEEAVTLAGEISREAAMSHAEEAVSHAREGGIHARAMQSSSLESILDKVLFFR